VTCTIDPQVGPVTGQVGTELTFFITVTGYASSNKLPSFKVVDGQLPPGTKLFDFAGSTGLINGVPKTAGSFTFTVQVKDETRATDTETFTIEILPAEAPMITTVALSGGTVGEFYCCGNLFASRGSSPIAGRWSPGRCLPAWSCRGGRTPSPERPPRLVRLPSPSGSPTIWVPSVSRSSRSRSVERQPAASAIPSMPPAISTAAVIGSLAMPRGTPAWHGRSRITWALEASNGAVPVWATISWQPEPRAPDRGLVPSGSKLCRPGRSIADGMACVTRR
jgi:Putative Ig domain